MSESGPDYSPKIANWLLFPPILVRLFRAFLFPAFVMTRHEFGERFYRSAYLGRLIFYIMLWPMPLFVHGPAGYIMAILANLTALVWFVRCDRQSRREIKTRNKALVQVHSYSWGVPRFGLPDDEQSNTVTLPVRLFLAGVLTLFVSASMGAYLGCAAMAIAAEAGWRKQARHNAELDAADESLALSGVTSRTLAAVQPAAATTPRRAAVDPLANFGEVLARPEGHK